MTKKPRVLRIDEDFLMWVWEQQPGRFIRVSARGPDTETVKGKEVLAWRDHLSDSAEDAIYWLKSQPQGADLYFCPHKFTERSRRKKSAAATLFLWADLDEVNPNKVAKNLRPAVAWESSPGRYQCLWRLEEEVPPQEAEHRGKALTYRLGADRGGWDLTQVLRVPGTVNHKYPAKPVVKLLWREDDRVTGSDVLPVDAPAERPQGAQEALQPDLRGLIAKAAKRVSKKVLDYLLMVEEPEPGQRSDILWLLHHELARSGLAAGEIALLVKHSVWNKYRGRSDEDERIATEISKVLTQTLPPLTPEQVDPIARETRQEIAQGRFVVHTDLQLMSNLVSAPGWLVEEFWTRESHGLIGGEPKSFKTLLSLDFAVSVASGKPFLGHRVPTPGPVLIVQKENSAWIMKDRLTKIRVSKGLLPTVELNGEQTVIRGMLEGDGRDLPLFYINQQPVNFLNEADREAIEAVIAQVKPVLIQFDPFYLMFDGDFNSAKDLNPVLNWLLDLKNRYKTSVQLIHHMRKSKDSTRGGQQMLGSTTIHGWSESAWYVKNPKLVSRGAQGESDAQGDDEGQDWGPEVSPEGEDPVSYAESEIEVEREFRGAEPKNVCRVSVRLGAPGSLVYGLSEITEAGKRPHSDSKKVSKVKFRSGTGLTAAQEETRIYTALAQGPKDSEQIASETGIPLEIVWQHLRRLRANNRVRKDKKLYSLVSP